MLTRDRICELIQERQDLLTKVKNSGLPVVIYGAGVGAGVAIQYLMANDITPTACMVDPPYYSEKMVKIYQDESGNEYTFPVYSTENIVDIYPKFAQIRGCCYNFYRHPNAAEYVTPVLPMGIFADLERITGEYVLENYEIFADVERLFDTNCPPPSLSARQKFNF